MPTHQQFPTDVTIYDHANNTRWGITDLAQMMALDETAPTVYNEFMAGNCVVKEAEGLFNQVHTDMALEHINKLCKIAGSIVGITQSKTACDSWMLTCCGLSHLSEDKRKQARLTSGKGNLKRTPDVHT